jgi:hypothetical protein
LLIIVIVQCDILDSPCVDFLAINGLPTHVNPN